MNKLNDVLKEVSFQKYGEHKIRFELNGDEINMDYMFKDVKSLVNVQMNSNKEVEITSMKSTFENCESLDNLTITGFNTENLISIEKIFYKSNLKNLIFDIKIFIY